MKSFPFFIAAGTILLSSCSIVINSQKSNPPVYNDECKRNKFVFVNCYDYTVSDYVKNKHEATYAKAINGFSSGLGSVFNEDTTASFFIADTLLKGFNTGIIPDSVIVTLCKIHNADMLISVDSVYLGFDWDITTEEDEDGKLMAAKNYFLIVKPFISLYDSTGFTIDRCYLERTVLYRSRPTVIGILSPKPSLKIAGETIESLSEDEGIEFADKFYPSTEFVALSFFTGRQFDTAIAEVKAGNLDRAVEILTPLTKSSQKGLARKASHNLSMVKQMIETEINNRTVMNK